MALKELSIDTRVLEAIRLVQKSVDDLQELPTNERLQVQVCITTRDAESEFNDYHRWCANFDKCSIETARNEIMSVFESAWALLASHQSPYTESVLKRLNRIKQFSI